MSFDCVDAGNGGRIDNLLVKTYFEFVVDFLQHQLRQRSLSFLGEIDPNR
ncbi:MAG: hypothetical protein DMG06_22225 [Acidobacteria bacterium]|nr:MAG: hypothetical protein DMG06_22225 [Acidobacteriota bacterium]